MITVGLIDYIEVACILSIQCSVKSIHMSKSNLIMLQTTLPDCFGELMTVAVEYILAW